MNGKKRMREIGPGKLSRRSFLGVSAAGLAIVPTYCQAGTLLSFLRPTPLPMAIGFSEEGADRCHNANLLRSDPDLWRTGVAQVTIHSLYQAATRPDLQRFWLDVAYTPDDRLRFHAWCYNREPIASASAPVSFTVPLQPCRGLRMIVGAKIRSQTGNVEESRLPLHFGIGKGQAALRPGTYAVALQHGVKTDTAWQHLVWRQDHSAETTEGPLFRGSEPYSKLVSFPYLLFSVSHVDNDQTFT